MKDLVTLLFVLVLGAGVAGGFFWWKGEQAKAADLAYEQAIDDAMNRSINSFHLEPLMTGVETAEGEARLEALRAAYQTAEADNIEEYDRINMGFGNLQGDWPTTYGHVAENARRQTDRSRFAAEIEERFGPGSHAFMRTEYQRFMTELPQRTAEREAAAHRDAQIMGRALENYRRQHGRYPERGFRVVDGRIVEQ